MNENNHSDSKYNQIKTQENKQMQPKRLIRILPQPNSRSPINRNRNPYNRRPYGFINLNILAVIIAIGIIVGIVVNTLTK